MPSLQIAVTRLFDVKNTCADVSPLTLNVSSLLAPSFNNLLAPTLPDVEPTWVCWQNSNQVGPVQHESFWKAANFFSFQPHNFLQWIRVVNPQSIVHCAQEAWGVWIHWHKVCLLWHYLIYELYTSRVTFVICIWIFI